MALVINRIGCHNRPAEYKSLPRIPARWTYTTTDNLTQLTSTGYFNLAYKLGMRDGDSIDTAYIDEITQTIGTVLLLIREVGEHFVALPIVLTLQPKTLVEDITIVTGGVDTDTGISIPDTVKGSLDEVTALFKWDVDGDTYGIKDVASALFLLNERDIKILRTVSSGANTQTLRLWVDGVTDTIWYNFTTSGAPITNALYKFTIVEVR